MNHTDTPSTAPRPKPWNRTAHFISGMVMVLFGPAVSASVVAWLCWLAGFQHRSIFFWIPISPVLYFVWLNVLLLFYDAETTLLAPFFKRPRRYHELEDARNDRQFMIAIGLYSRGIMLTSLPLMSLLILLPGFGRLILRAYSTRLFLGKNSPVGGFISDPDLTTIGSDVVFGYFCKITAHSLIRSADGFLVYQTAPIELGDGCTIGGSSLVEMGAKIGAHSLIEHGSRVAPFTIVPAGEVWGGNPAVFRRKREDGLHASKPAEAAPVIAQVHGEIPALIARALSLPEGSVTRETGAKNCLAWDSMGKMFIGAAVHDCYGITLPPDTVFKLDSVADVERAVVAATRPASARDIESFSLPAHPELLPLLDPAKTIAALAAKPPKTSGEPLGILVASTFVCHPLATALQLYAGAFGIRTDIQFLEFNQVAQALLSADSPFRKNRAGLNVVLVRGEDLMPAGGGSAAEQARQLLGAIKSFASDGGQLLVSDLPPSPELDPGRKNEFAKLRLNWREELESLDGIQILPFADLIEEIGAANARDAQMGTAASAPFSAAVYQRLGVAIAREARRLRMPPKKVVAVDADGTLWGGVIAEDGVGGIQVSDDPAGRGHKLLQAALLDLKKRGILLVLASKNEAADIWAALEKHPGMLLRREDFAAARINWQPKSQNLREIAGELNLDSSSFVFLDDKPAERLEVETNCPEVTVVPLPTEAALYAETLSKLWLFDGAGGTREDELRSDYMRKEAERKQLRESSANLQDYLQSLELQVVLRRAQPDDFARVAQLSERTSQFNLSLKRHSAAELRDLAASCEIWVVSAKDRLGDYGTVGASICRRVGDALVMETLLTSCRALGCGVEDAFLHAMATHGKTAGAKVLCAHFVQGPRNQPIKAFLTRTGFGSGKNGTYELDLSIIPQLPEHVRLAVT